MTKEIRAIKRWLKFEGNSEVVLASKLGYTSSVAIKMWIKRNNVPTYMRDRLTEVLEA